MIIVNQKCLFLSLVAGVLSLFTVYSSLAQGTAFSYQGQLGNNGTAANGSYDFQFTAFNAVTNGSAASGTVTNFTVAVSNGLFLTTIDLGSGVFTGTNLWLAIGVRTNGTATFTPLFPRQPILPVPYAIFANSASNLLGTLQAAQLSGTLPGSAFTGFTNMVSLTNGANLFTGSFSGNGAGITNVSVTNLTGVLADFQLPTNTAFLNSNQTFTASNTFNGVNTFTNLANSFSGSFFGNGLVGWIVVSGFAVQAQSDHGYLLTNSQLITVTLPASPNVGDIVRIACSGASGWQLAQNAGQSVLGNFLSYGKTWFKSGAQAYNWTSIASSEDGTRMAATVDVSGNDNIYLSQNSGQTWSATSAANTVNKQWQAIAMSADGTKLVAVVTNGGGIYTSGDAGNTWTQVAIGAGPSSVASSANGSNLVATIYNGDIYTNVGTSWIASGAPVGFWTAVASSANGVNLVAADSGTGIYVSANAGSTWNDVKPAALNWTSVATSASGNRLIAAAAGNSVYVSTNSGANWTQQTGIPTTANWYAVASSGDGSKLAAAVNGGFIYTSANGGATWQTNATTALWAAATISSDGTTLAAAINDTSTIDNNGIYLSTGTSQSVTTTGMTGSLYGGPGSAVELIYIGNNQFMPVSFSGQIWAY